MIDSVNQRGVMKIGDSIALEDLNSKTVNTYTVCGIGKQYLYVLDAGDNMYRTSKCCPIWVESIG